MHAHNGCAAWVYACVHTWWQLARTLQSWRHCDDLSQHSTLWCHWLKYHMEWHMALGTELTCLPAYLPARGEAAGQSHFQQINLIWKFSSPCNLKQQQQGSASPPILNSFLSRLFLLFLPLSSPRRSYWMRGGKGMDKGLDECEKRRREGKRDGGGGEEGW